MLPLQLLTASCLALTASVSATVPRPVVWIYTDMSDKTIPGKNHMGTVNDPDDISAMAGYLLLANKFDTRGIVVASTHRNEHATTPDQAIWANETFGDAYRSEVARLNRALGGGFPDDIQFMESCIKRTAERYAMDESYVSLDRYPTVRSLLDEVLREPAGSLINVLCWGSLTEPAIFVNHCLATDRSEQLAKVRFIAHWTNSPLHQGTPEHPEHVANCREDAAACAYLKRCALEGLIDYRELGAIGQHGIVSGAPNGAEYYDQFIVSRLGRLFAEGKFVHATVDHSDSATYWTLLGTMGVTLADVPPDGTNSAAVEQANEDKFRTHSQALHDELLRRARAAAGGASQTSSPPNVVLILADDMGFSDIGCYGSEIPTPNLDALAADGLRFSQFYNTARCSPTRAALLTGLHPHQAGMGTLAEDPGKQAPADAAPGYQEYLNDRCITLAEALKPSGYHTYMSGKWHLGYHGEAKWPLQRGFDRFYGLISGASSYFHPKAPRGLTLDNTPLPPPSEPGYYTTDAFADHALHFLSEQKGDAPFFLYLAFNAPHWPLHARDEDVAKFVGRYRAGWDSLRETRLARQKALGIVPPQTELSPRDDGVRAWTELTDEQKTQLDYRMAVYAAQVHRMDWNIGRIVDHLRSTGKLENTIIFFLSDNGGCAEPYDDLGGGDFSAINDPDAGGAGGANARRSGSSYGTGWANASNTPFRRYKSRLHQGGIATPLIVHWPAGLKTQPGSLTQAPGYLTDIMPTVLEVTGTMYPSFRHGVALTPLAGESLAPIFSTSTRKSPEFFFWEQYNNKAVRRGDWKAVQPAELGSPWELYNLASDPTELHDRAASEPEILRDLTTAWRTWAESNQVLPKKKAAVPAASL